MEDEDRVTRDLKAEAALATLKGLDEAFSLLSFDRVRSMAGDGGSNFCLAILLGDQGGSARIVGGLRVFLATSFFATLLGVVVKQLAFAFEVVRFFGGMIE